MRILQLIQKKQLRGAEIFAAQISTHMVKAGHELLIVSLGKGDAVLPFTGEIISLNADFGKKYFDWGAWKRLAGIIERFKPDIIQANAGDTLKYAVFSKKIFRWKQPVIFRNASMVSRYATGRFSKSVTSFLLKNADHIISVSQETKTDLVNYFQLEEKKISVIPVGIEMKRVENLAAFDNDCVNLVHVGGFSFEKNHERLLHMFKALFLKDYRFRLWLIGDGPLMGKIKTLADELEISKYIFFKGFIANPLDYIGSADMLLLPSKIEGLPAVILEAFYCRVPVLAYNVGGIAALVKNNETGWLVEKEDEAGFIAAVLEVKNKNKNDVLPIIENAYNQVISNYLNSQIAASFLQTYQLQRAV